MDNELRQLGLTPNEIKVYNTLLEIGENTVGPVIKITGMHRQVAYDALEGLEKRNMIAKTTKTNRLYFRVADPQNILENIKQQGVMANRLVREISSKLKGQKRGQEIRVYEGEKDYRDLIKRKNDLQPPNTTYMVVSGMSLFYKDMMTKENVYENINRIRSERNINTKIILNDMHREEGKLLNRVNSETRYLPEGFTSPTSFDIWHDSITLIAHASGVFCIEIKNDDFHKSYVTYFNLLWKIAKR